MTELIWIPAFAGMTILRSCERLLRFTRNDGKDGIPDQVRDDNPPPPLILPRVGGRRIENGFPIKVFGNDNRIGKRLPRLLGSLAMTEKMRY